MLQEFSERSKSAPSISSKERSALTKRTLMEAIKIPLLFSRYPVFLQLVRFGIVGLSAASVNLFIVFLLVHYRHLHPLSANIIAFLISFQISYNGHKYWTFRSSASHLTSMSKFFFVAVFSSFMHYCFRLSKLTIYSHCF